MPLANEVLSLFTRLDYAWGLAMTHTGLGVAALRQGVYERALSHLEIAEREHHRSGDVRGQAEVLNNLGLVARMQGQPERSAAPHAQSLRMFQELGDDWEAAAALNNLGTLARDRGDLDRAAELHREAMQLYSQVGDQRGIGTSLERHQPSTRQYHSWTVRRRWAARWDSRCSTQRSLGGARWQPRKHSVSQPQLSRRAGHWPFSGPSIPLGFSQPSRRLISPPNCHVPTKATRHPEYSRPPAWHRRRLQPNAL